MIETKTYSTPIETDDTMANEAMVQQYGSVETLKLLCLEKIMKLNDRSMLVDVIHIINARPQYTIEELHSRSDEAYAEFEQGGGKEGEVFFSELNQYILSR